MMPEKKQHFALKNKEKTFFFRESIGDSGSVS